jgi:hypothetical protein
MSQITTSCTTRLRNSVEFGASLLLLLVLSGCSSSTQVDAAAENRLSGVPTCLMHAYEATVSKGTAEIDEDLKKQDDISDILSARFVIPPSQALETDIQTAIRDAKFGLSNAKQAKEPKSWLDHCRDELAPWDLEPWQSSSLDYWKLMAIVGYSLGDQEIMAEAVGIMEQNSDKLDDSARVLLIKVKPHIQYTSAQALKGMARTVRKEVMDDRDFLSPLRCEGNTSVVLAALSQEDLEWARFCAARSDSLALRCLAAAYLPPRELLAFNMGHVWVGYRDPDSRSDEPSHISVGAAGSWANPKSAERLLLAAARRGDPDAMGDLCFFYSDTIGIGDNYGELTVSIPPLLNERDFARSVAWGRRASQHGSSAYVRQGLSFARCFRGLVPSYMNGAGGSQTLSSIEWSVAGAEMGDVNFNGINGNGILIALMIQASNGGDQEASSLLLSDSSSIAAIRQAADAGSEGCREWLVKEGIQ